MVNFLFRGFSDRCADCSNDLLSVAPLAHNHRSLSWGNRLLTLDKSADFMGEPAFATALRTICGSINTTSITDRTVSLGVSAP
jgi:hypothetical protein